MKKIEWKLISELMKNSRRSDRELAQAIGVSQPTVSRTIKKLEKEECIKEYTMIPDFSKLGYEIAALTFVKLKKGLGVEEVDKAKKIAKEHLKENSLEIMMVERGMGLGYDGVFVSLHEDYTSYLKFKNRVTQDAHLEASSTESFLISLSYETRFRPLTFSALAKHLLMLKEKEKE
jgi:DNA-binding Lrp family transcriptional regulator